jgi:hypothetical protein
MNDPRRLTDGELDVLARSVLTSADKDAPSARARTRTLVALGVGAATATTAGAATATTTGLVVTLKWVGVGVVVAGVVNAGIATYDATRASAPTAPVAALSAVASPRPPAPTAAPTPAPNVPPPPLQTASAQAPAKSPSAAPPAPRARPIDTSADATAADLATLDRVKTALDSGDAARALLILEANPAVARGAFAPEAKVLRIEALARTGDDARANAEARAFLDAYPTSPASRRVRTVLSNLEKKP